MVDIPGDNSTTASMVVGEVFEGELELAGDKDWIAITLTGGKSYSISLSGLTGGPTDTLVRVYDSNGAIVATDDDGGQGLFALATLTPATTATYYVEAGAFGDETGGYAVQVEETPPPEFLDSIRWGRKLPSTTVNVYFAETGEVFDGKTSVGWNAYEQQQAMLAFQLFANVCNLTFNVVTDQSQATFTLVNKEKAPWLGYFNPPGTRGEGIGVFNQGGTGWDEDLPGTGGLEQGGYGFITLIHEFGHGLGMAHPHDGGGTSTTWEGVTDAFDSFGTFDLNQGIYTMMSYNDGWQLHPAGENTANEYGWEGTLMAFDVAMMQKLYGANTSYHSGDDTYVLPDENALGSYFSCIWDAGGTDEMTYAGTRDITIDLRAAHLGYAAGSGGYISYADGIYGGFTIANGVVIEKATGGSGNDEIVGNGVANVIHGGDGRDEIYGMSGRDELHGDGGRDTMCGGLGADEMRAFGLGDTFLYLSTQDSGATRPQSDKILNFVSGNHFIDLSALDASTGGTEDDAFSFIGNTRFTGAAGELRWKAVAGAMMILADLDGDRDADFALTLVGAASVAETDILL